MPRHKDAKAREKRNLEIIAAFKRGETMTSIAQRVDLDLSLVSRFLSRLGLNVRRRKTKRNGKILAAVKSGEKVSAVAARFNLTPISIYSILGKEGYHRRPKVTRVDKNMQIPLKPGKQTQSYPWDKMQITDSFFIKNGSISATRSAASIHGKRLDMVFRVATVEGGVRVWRII